MKKTRSALSYISLQVGKAMGDYPMLKDGDKVLVAVSGGKDSLSLLHILQHRQKFIPVKVKLLAVHIEMGIPGFPLGKLKKYLQKQSVPSHIEKIDFLKGRTWDDIDCFVCSLERRKALFRLAKKMDFNKIAFGHHMDDIAETILLNLFYRGEIGSMCPYQEMFKGKLAIIRPLAYVRESDIKVLKKEEKLMAIDKFQCPNDETSKRKRLKRMIAKLEKENPAVKKNIIKALKNIKTEYLP